MNDNIKQIMEVIKHNYDVNRKMNINDIILVTSVALDRLGYRKQSETAKEFAEKAISEVFEKITQRFCDIYYSGLNRECPDSILSEHYQSAFDECKEIVKNSIAELAASFGTEVEE